MKSKELAESDPWRERNFVLVLDDAEEAFDAITRFAHENEIGGASLTAIGAFRTATLGFFDFGTKSYKEIAVDEQTEVVSAIGDVATGDGEPSCPCGSRSVRRHYQRRPSSQSNRPSDLGDHFAGKRGRLPS
jgi:hypothetical protein